MLFKYSIFYFWLSLLILDLRIYETPSAEDLYSSYLLASTGVVG